jgi:hypothetical protein
VLYELFRAWPEEPIKLSRAERTARSEYEDELGLTSEAADRLFRIPSKEDWEARQQRQYSALSLKASQTYLTFLSDQLRRIAIRLYDTAPSKRSKSEYGGAYARYIRVRRLLGPAEMQRIVWDKLDRPSMWHWKWFAAWRNQQRKLRSKNRIKWLEETHPQLESQRAAVKRYNASEAARAAKRAYDQSEKGKAARAKREAARAKRDADLLATPADEVIPEAAE